MNPLLKTPQIWPVIHVGSQNQNLALENAKIAADCQCQGVFLISMEGDDNIIPPLANTVQSTFPQLNVGINLLQHSPTAALQKALDHKLSATWADQTLFTDKPTAAQTDEIFKIQKIRENTPHHQIFTSVSFKYQKSDPNPGQSAKLAASYGFIPTTSGPGTGQAASTGKLENLRAALGEKPLAVASGVTPDNIQNHIGLVTHILVATGISRSFYEFDEKLLQNLMQKIDH